MSEAQVRLLVAAFEGEQAAEEALKALRESREDQLIGIQAAVAMRNDELGRIRFRDVGMTPGKGALGGVVLGAVVGILTGGTGLALGAVGAVAGGLVGKKKRDSRFSTDQVNQVASSLSPGSSALVIVMEPGWVVVLEKELEALGADVLTTDISADVAHQLEQSHEVAYSTLASELNLAAGGSASGEDDLQNESRRRS